MPGKYRYLVLVTLLCLFLLLPLVSSLAQPPVTGTLSLGPGFTDGIPRQIVRTADDYVYAFAVEAQYSDQINVYRSTAPGLPENFTIAAGMAVGSPPLSLDAVYDGDSMVHVLANTQAGVLLDFPFDTAANTFKAPIIIASGLPTVTGAYIGTVGVSGLFDREGRLNIAYWSANDHITFATYSYSEADNTLTVVDSPVQLDSSGSATHPALAVSPVDGSVTAAWVSEAARTAVVLTRTRTGWTWGAEEAASAAPLWVSRDAGVNIDQGPNMLITGDGARHLVYIENWDNTGHYGHLHYASKTGEGGWIDQAIPFYTHNPALATTSSDQLFIIGHGSVATGENENLYYLKKQADGTWAVPQPIIGASGAETFDASASVKWSVMGWNRPNLIEFVFFGTINHDYDDTMLHYGYLDAGSETTPTPVPVLSPTHTPPTSTALPTVTSAPTQPPETGETHELMVQVGGSWDDANEDSGEVNGIAGTIWIGNGSDPAGSHLGLRFEGISIPQGAVVTSALVEFYSTSDQWQNLSLEIAGEAAGSAQPFNTTPPSQRPPTGARVIHVSNVQWQAETWYALEPVTPLVQEIVNRADWTPGGSLALIFRGTGAMWSRHFAASSDGSLAFAPRLTVSYTLAGGS